MVSRNFYILNFLLATSVIGGVCYRTSTCERQHEQFSLCGWKCPATCVNMRMLSEGTGQLCSAVWECRVGCRCTAGYIRDEYSKGCILVTDCPENKETEKDG